MWACTYKLVQACLEFLQQKMADIWQFMGFDHVHVQDSAFAGCVRESILQGASEGAIMNQHDTRH